MIMPDKASMVISRLLPRLRARGAPTLSAYVQALRLPSEEPERRLVVDQLTTHETCFFREPKHFVVLDKFARDARPGSLRTGGNHRPLLRSRQTRPLRDLGQGPHAASTKAFLVQRAYRNARRNRRALGNARCHG
jgi:hypothetical protein